MKLLKMALLAGAFFAVTSAQAQTAQDIVNKHIAAVGGMDNWNKVTSYKVDITMTQKAQNMGIGLRLAVVKDKVVWMQQEAMGNKMIVSVTPTSGWQSDGTKTKDIPADKVAAAYAETAEQFSFTDELIVATQKKYKMELQGKEQVKGKDAYKISVIDNDADETVYYVDAATYQIVRQTEKTEVEGEEVENVSDFSNFQQIKPLGITMAMSMETPELKFEYKKVELNNLTESDPMFARPNK